MKLALNALTLPRNLAGIGFYTEKLIENLAAIDPGIAITLFTNREAADAIRIPGNVRVEGFGFSSTIGKALAAQALLPRRLAGFDLLHSVGNVGLFSCPIPQAVTIHDLCQRVVPSRFGALKRAYLNLGEAWSTRSCGRIISVSHSTSRDLIRYYPKASGKIDTIHSASKYAVDRRPPSTGGDFLFVGTLEPGKNLVLALAALARLRDSHGVTGNLRVVGARGWKQTRLPEIIAGLGLGSQTTFLGYLDDEALKTEYRSAACLVFPSMYEGFGLPILEAQSQGCPVVSADNSSLREIGGTGCHYFPTGDVDALTELLLRSRSDPKGFSRIREDGYGNCARFDWARTARETLESYRACMAAAKA
ncbi:MAG: glycosyl transferase group 1 [Fibrobacteres bacterium]|nr:glycosyl transferase group 1 [Fibrobacterota bacterium]